MTSGAPTTRWLITGAGGMLATDLVAVLNESNAVGGAQIEVTALDRATLDITDPDAVAARVTGHDVVVNAAAYTAVDQAESDESRAFAVNAVGPQLLARACAGAGASLVQISTDYVFDGHASIPYAEDAALAPRSAYGRTKAAGEWAVRAELPAAHWILRTAWLYGAAGPNFVSTMARLAMTRPTVEVVTDQIGSPTWSVDLARQVLAVVRAQAPAGTYHATSSGQASWFEFAQAVFEGLGLDRARVLPTDSGAFKRPAPRPAWSVLGQERWAAVGVTPIRDWRAALAQAQTETALGTLPS